MMDMKERMNSGELYIDSGYGLPQQRLMGKEPMSTTTPIRLTRN